VVVGDFPVHECLGDDADDGAASGHGGIRGGAHEADVAASVNKGVATGGNPGAGSARGFQEGGVSAGRGTAVNAKGGHDVDQRSGMVRST